MIPDETNHSQESRQELIDLLSRMAKSTDVEEGEILGQDDQNGNIDDEEEEEGEISGKKNKDVEDGELTSDSAEKDSDDVEELNLRLNALKSLPAAKKTKRYSKTRRKRTNYSNRSHLDDTDLRSPPKSRTSSRYANADDREYLLDKDYRQPSVFDMLLSLITPETRSNYPINRHLHDNYDVQQMEIVDEPVAPVILPPPPPPPPPAPIFDLMPPIPWPRPNFVQQYPPEPWINPFPSHTDIDLRQLPPPLLPPVPLQPEMIPTPKRKRPKKPRKEKTVPKKNEEKEEEDEEERRLREELLRTISTKRQVKPNEPERIVTIVPPPAAPPPAPPAKPQENQYTVNNRYKRVKASASMTNLAARPTAPIIQTRNKIVRVTETAESEAPPSNQIIIRFDDHTSEDEEPPNVKKSSDSQFQISEEERLAIKRLSQVQSAALRQNNEAPPSTDELSAVFEKRRILLQEREKYKEIQEKMKKKNVENGLLTRDIERLEAQLNKKKTLMEKNHLLLQYWQKEAMNIAQNIKEQEESILQSAVFKSVRPNTVPMKVQSSVEIESMRLSQVFQEQNRKLLLSVLICPWSLYCELRPYRRWVDRFTQSIEENEGNASETPLLRARGLTRTNDDQYWKTCLQAYFTDINQILCPYELQGSCKAQNCFYQHQYQITQRMEEYLSTKKVEQKVFSNLDGLKSIQPLDLDWNQLEKKINEKQYQRARMKLDRYLNLSSDDFRYFSLSNGHSQVHSILLSVSNQLDAEDFSLEHSVAELVEGLESNRSNAQLWCLYLEFSSWNMSNEELHHLCSAALKNAQSYDLFWTIFDLCPNHFDEYLPFYNAFLQSDSVDRSFAQCELTMFHAHLAEDAEQACQRLQMRDLFVQNSLNQPDLEREHRLYLSLVYLYTFAFGTFPTLLYQHFEQSRWNDHIVDEQCRLRENFQIEPFICPWYASATYAHSIEQIDELIESLCQTEKHLSIHLNQIHFFNATKRFDLAKISLESLVEENPTSIELWIEYLLNPEISSELPSIFARACASTGVVHELIYALSSLPEISALPQDSSEFRTERERFFFNLSDFLSNSKRNLSQLFLLTPVQFHRSFLFHLIEKISSIPLESFRTIIDHLIFSYSWHERVLFIYSFFHLLPLTRLFDLIIDCFLTNHHYQWLLQPFAYRLFDHRSSSTLTLFWIRFDGFLKQILYQSSRMEIYLILLQRLIDSKEEKSKINRLCRLFDTHYPHHSLLSPEFRRMMEQIR